jgi:hypothetical protein
MKIEIKPFIHDSDSTLFEPRQPLATVFLSLLNQLVWHFAKKHFFIKLEVQVRVRL